MGRSPLARQLVKAEPAATSSAIRGARDAQLALLAEPARVPAAMGGRQLDVKRSAAHSDPDVMVLGTG
jgi:hypothetical protein